MGNYTEKLCVIFLCQELEKVNKMKSDASPPWAGHSDAMRKLNSALIYRIGPAPKEERGEQREGNKVITISKTICMPILSQVIEYFGMHSFQKLLKIMKYLHDLIFKVKPDHLGHLEVEDEDEDEEIGPKEKDGERPEAEMALSEASAHTKAIVNYFSRMAGKEGNDEKVRKISVLSVKGFFNWDRG